MENNYQMFFPISSSTASHAGLAFSDHPQFDHGGSSSTSGPLKLEPKSEAKLVPLHDSPSRSRSGTGSFTGSDETTEKNNLGKTEKHNKVRKPRYAFQTRSQVDILDDGYRWRKYGQKAVKNNKFPRSYYRCTHEGCNVKKQVQRLTKDENVVVTTYEGNHTHPIEKPTDNFEHILSQMQIYATPFQ